ncbi:MAG: type II toxin-antitoxin system PemK/MazF family toxin [Caulobacteraceae bacterium]
MTEGRVATPYEPGPGDLIWTDFDPRTGREQGGRRPALVLSPAALYAASGFVIACPITSRVREFGSSVRVPDGLPISGEILTYQVRSLDTSARPIRFAGAVVPDEVLAEVRAKLAILCGIEC